MRRTFGIRFLLGCLALSSSAIAHGQTVEWIGTTGSFTDGANWDGGFVPDFGETALLNNGGTAQYSDDSADLQLLQIGLSNGTGHFEQSGGSFLAKGAFIADAGSGTATITGGEFAIGGDSIHVGLNPGAVGVMNVSGADTIVSSGDDFQLGRDGNGTLNFSGGFIRAGYTVIGKFGTGTWNQTGGMFDQDFGDIEIGDGGRDDQSDTPGPRSGTMNIRGGFVQTADSIAIGNRRGDGAVNISAGVLAATGGATSSILIGRGMDTSAGEGGVNSLRVIGGDSMIVATGSVLMDPNGAVQSATLIEEITGKTQTTIYAAGGADVTSGILKVELNGYTPVANDSWLLMEVGGDIDPILASIDSAVDAAGFDPLSHGIPDNFGELLGPFKATDFSGAPLSPGLSWDIAYTNETIVLSVIGTGGILGDFNNDGILDATDIDDLTTQAASGTNPASYDLTGDNQVNEADIDEWIRSDAIFKSYIGDANLDKQFDTSDLVALFAAGTYENGQTAKWTSGDFNGDGLFTTGDLVAALTDGGYEQGPRAAVSAVPEPTSLLLMMTGLAGFALTRRRR